MVLVALGGVAWGLCHGAVTLPWLATLALVPLLIGLSARRPFLLGWLFGTVAWIVAIPWIVPTLTTYGRVAGWLAALGLVALAAFLALYDAAFAALGARLWRDGRPLSLAALPALWVSLEVLRGRLFSGFPWNLAAYTWVDVPGALELSSWIGAWGVSFLVVAVNVGMARAWRARRLQPALVTLLIAATLLPIAARFLRVSDPRRPAPGVAVLQPDIPDRPYFDAAANEADYRRLLAASRAACRPGELLLWPESAAWPRSWQDDVRLRLDVQELVAEGGCSLLLNTAYREGDRTYNSVLLVDRAPSAAAGERQERLAATEGLVVQRADKRHLVPFGEYVPLRSVLPYAGKIARLVGDFSPARSIELLDWRREKLGAAVCYEVVFPSETAALVRAGASLLVTVTNDGWYGDSAAPRQHLRAARFRAAENRRWLLRAAVTGISAIVRPDGSLAARADVGETRTLEGHVVGRRDRTPFSRLPWLVPALCALLAALAIVRSRRARGAS